MYKALKQYDIIVRRIAKEYTDELKVKELREDHPELNFMDDEELETMLSLAKTIRNK